MKSLNQIHYTVDTKVMEEDGGDLRNGVLGDLYISDGKSQITISCTYIDDWLLSFLEFPIDLHSLDRDGVIDSGVEPIPIDYELSGNTIHLKYKENHLSFEPPTFIHMVREVTITFLKEMEELYGEEIHHIEYFEDELEKLPDLNQG